MILDASHEFQTNPRGVEAAGSGAKPMSQAMFQTNPRGVEAVPPTAQSAAPRFQTNPRGVEAGSTACVSLPAATFQTNPRGVEANSTGKNPDDSGVSDEPSWG